MGERLTMWLTADDGHAGREVRISRNINPDNKAELPITAEALVGSVEKSGQYATAKGSSVPDALAKLGQMV